ncbi:MAG: aminopeptidase [Eubacteriales bacterium]|nr:aminopeptidase [Clostridiales bacterium]MDY3071455.1 aminopeptidase [Eubacteriales bacterium]MDY5016103.1 aminopeptidase [Eubacteriales bacterium]
MKDLREQLFYTPKNGYDRIGEEQRDAIFALGEDYKAFLNHARTERAAVQYCVQIAESAGFVPYREGMPLTAGDRIYTVNRGKAIMLAVIGRKSLAEGIRIAAAHVDAPRLDLKPLPLTQEAGELCTLRTHYYGGIKKYQWTAIPLALQGVVALRDGSVVDVEIGTHPGDPVFTVTDILPHLGKDQMAKSAAEAVTGENLRVLCGSVPEGDPKDSDRVRFAVLKLLNEQYGMTEADFLSAELSIVPAFPACDVGFDRALVGGYGQDDRSCAFAELSALAAVKVPEKTAVCIFADKEEIGSVGATGMQSQYFDMFIASLCRAQGVALLDCFGRSECLSADVSAAYDPLYAEAYEKSNSAFANYGMSLVKYTGSRGKSGSNDANAEYLGRLRRAFDDAGVVYHCCELGKVDQGGGGTVAGFMGNRNIETVDVGVPVLSMHAPFEVVSKLDVYMTTRAIRAFYMMDSDEEDGE